MKYPFLLAVALCCIGCESSRHDQAGVAPIIVPNPPYFPTYSVEKQQRITQHAVAFLQQRVRRGESIWVYVPTELTPEGELRLISDPDGTRRLLVELSVRDLKALLVHPTGMQQVIDDYRDPDSASLRDRSTSSAEAGAVREYPFNLYLDDRYPRMVFLHANEEAELGDFPAAFYAPRVWQKIKKEYERLGVEFTKTGQHEDGFVYKPSMRQ